jgi:hypothetical protein
VRTHARLPLALASGWWGRALATGFEVGWALHPRHRCASLREIHVSVMKLWRSPRHAIRIHNAGTRQALAYMRT